jgi:acetyl esterase/lipase
MIKRLITALTLLTTTGELAMAETRTLTLQAPNAPSLHVQGYAPAGTDRLRPILYVHGATLGSTSSVLLPIDGISVAEWTGC